LLILDVLQIKCTERFCFIMCNTETCSFYSTYTVQIPLMVRYTIGLYAM
jgi:hypothetical protein